jgi:DNA-binding HxlR family transcriptional regulator
VFRHGRGIDIGEEAAIPTVPPPKRHPYNQWTPDARALDLVGDKWTLLIVRDLAAGPRRFVELQRVLPGISTEQLRSRLNRMVADGLLTRQRYREVPPRVDYELTDRSRALLPVLGALARWGYEWAWDEPRSDESIDVGAIFRVVPGLIIPTEELTGVIELTVTHGDGNSRSYAVRIDAGEVAIEEREAPESDAQIAGQETEWLRALGPELDRDGLRIEGDERLATAVLDVIAGVALRSTRSADLTG